MMKKQMSLHDYDYNLPQELIAQDPLEDRSSSRLMVLDKTTGKTEHRVFREIIDELAGGLSGNQRYQSNSGKTFWKQSRNRCKN